MGMRTAPILVMTLGLLAATAAEAYAGGYVGVGIGSDGDLGGSISNHFSTDEDASTSRILLGQRFGALALEASLFGSQLHGASSYAPSGDYSTLSLGVDLKYHIGLVGGLEAYGKIGLNKTWLDSSEHSDWNYEGRGTELGLGLQYSFDLPITEVGLWLDYSRQTTELRDGVRQSLDGEISMLNLGISLGF